MAFTKETHISPTYTKTACAALVMINTNLAVTTIATALTIAKISNLGFLWYDTELTTATTQNKTNAGYGILCNDTDILCNSEKYDCIGAIIMINTNIVLFTVSVIAFTSNKKISNFGLAWYDVTKADASTMTIETAEAATYNKTQSDSVTMTKEELASFFTIAVNLFTTDNVSLVGRLWYDKETLSTTVCNKENY